MKNLTYAQTATNNNQNKIVLTKTIISTIFFIELIILTLTEIKIFKTFSILFDIIK